MPEGNGVMLLTRELDRMWREIDTLKRQIRELESQANAAFSTVDKRLKRLEGDDDAHR